ncbi:MAG TPA: PLDc N-terminal domain-containing protein [Ktedonobacterales bacterium]
MSVLDSGPTAAVVLLPLIVILDLVVVAYLIADLYKPERTVRGGNKTAWLIAILCVGMLVLVSTALGLVLQSGPNAAPIYAVFPLIAILLDLAVAGYLIVDLYNSERRVRGGDKTFWLVVILFFSILGFFAYLTYGRES